MENHITEFLKSQEPEEAKKKFIEKYQSFGLSFFPVGADKKPLIRWTEYQHRKPEPEEVLKWYFDFSDFNIGIVTGFNGFYSLDFDSIEAYKNFPNEYKNTATTQTRRGFHLNFYSEAVFKSQIIKINGYDIEFKGLGSYVVEPYSVIQGIPYKPIIPIDKIAKLPEYIIDKLQNTLQEEPHKPLIRWRYQGKQSCIRQILDKDLKEGEREISLFALYNLLTRENSIDYSKQIILKKNSTLRSPLPEQELKHIFEEKPYSFGCSFIRSNLPFVKCAGCPYFNFDFSKIYFSNQYTDTEKKVIYALFVMGIKDISQIAKMIGISNRWVYKCITTLKRKGLDLINYDDYK